MWVAGADACRSGWVVALLELCGEGASIGAIERFAELVALEPPWAVAAVDIPIGLPERIGLGGRGPEGAVRPLLKDRQSSVFTVPSRAAVYASDYREACTVARATSAPPKAISRQLFAIAPKIREVD